jgi:hypothetical protein
MDSTPNAFPNTGAAGARAGNGKGVLRERFDSEKDSVIESVVGKAESWAKKVGSGASGVMLDDIPKLLDALGLRIVDKSKICVDRAVYESYRTLAAAAISNPSKLVWDEGDSGPDGRR